MSFEEDDDMFAADWSQVEYERKKDEAIVALVKKQIKELQDNFLFW
jgi:hypothetical protein